MSSPRALISATSRPSVDRSSSIWGDGGRRVLGRDAVGRFGRQRQGYGDIGTAPVDARQISVLGSRSDDLDGQISHCSTLCRRRSCTTPSGRPLPRDLPRALRRKPSLPIIGTFVTKGGGTDGLRGAACLRENQNP